MPRQARIIYPGFFYHVLNRGNGKRIIFHKKQDYEMFINLMIKATVRFPLKIFSYCLMPNHFHLVVSPDKYDKLANWMHWLMTVYAKRYHFYHNTTGHLWQSRYKSFVIENDRHLFTVIRYVEGNPVRAGLVPSAKDWKWSSHRFNLGILTSSCENSFIPSRLPFPIPKDWGLFVDTPLLKKDLLNLRKCLRSNLPFGERQWMKIES